MAITKTVKRYGNSGGVYLPAKWIGGAARIELIQKPADPRKDLLSMPLEHVVCIIIYGSYARGEAEKDSDTDVIVVTDGSHVDIPSWMNRKYEINVRSVASVRQSVENDPVFYKFIKDESIALFNRSFLEELRNIKPKPGSILKFRLDTSESSLGIVKSFMELGYEPAGMAYPLMMRLKEALFIECFLNNRKYTTSLLKKEILAAGISSNDFDRLLYAYRIIRNGKKQPKIDIPAETIAKLAELLEKKISNVKQKTIEKRH